MIPETLKPILKNKTIYKINIKEVIPHREMNQTFRVKEVAQKIILDLAQTISQVIGVSYSGEDHPPSMEDPGGRIYKQNLVVMTHEEFEKLCSEIYKAGFKENLAEASRLYPKEES